LAAATRSQTQTGGAPCTAPLPWYPPRTCAKSINAAFEL
jgi:hypothetical protein